MVVPGWVAELRRLSCCCSSNLELCGWGCRGPGELFFVRPLVVEVAGVLPVDRVVGAFVDPLVVEVDSMLSVDRAVGAVGGAR